MKLGSRGLCRAAVAAVVVVGGMSLGLRKLVVTTITVMGLLLVASSPAMAAASATASCMGRSSDNAGFPRDRAVISHEIKAIASVDGLSPGALVRRLAQSHAGSTEACFGG
ncbi:MAG: hypothetical protein QOC92_4529 [Acidimicrobiaceae bacterium]|jgi:hypothetical protein